jgi:integrase
LKWIKTNPAKALKPPKVEMAQVVPFSNSEMEKILKACDSHPNKSRGLQLRALVLLMRYSGLRISDATAVRRNAIVNGILELRTQKTNVNVRVPLKPEVLTALKAIPKTNEYYFYSGTSKQRTCANVWQNTFLAMFKRAGIKGHSHQLRHTFAVSLLMNGVSMEDVAKLLGNSPRIVEKHYSAWTQGRQTRLEEAVKKTW